jgi:hypothetical protein
MKKVKKLKKKSSASVTVGDYEYCEAMPVARAEQEVKANGG